MPPKRRGKPGKGKPSSSKGGAKAAASTGTGKPGEHSQELPPRESKLLRDISREYEANQYKRAAKTADTILAKFPNHGETLAMKALAIYKLGRRKEALDMVERARKLNRKTHLTWHVSGLLLKQEKRYRDAVPMLRMAAMVSQRINKRPHDGLLKDVAALQLHLRDVRGFHSAAHELMESSNAVKMRGTWHTCALANHMSGYHDVAVELLLKDIENDEIKRNEDIVQAVSLARAAAKKRASGKSSAAAEDEAEAKARASARTEPTVEEQEAPLAVVRVLWESGKAEEAAVRLDDFCRRGYVMAEDEADRMRAGLALRRGDKALARECFERLAASNPEDVEPVAGLVLCELGAIPLEFAALQQRPRMMPGVHAATDTACGVWREPTYTMGRQFDFVAAPVGSEWAPVAASPLDEAGRTAVLAIVDRLAAASPRSYALRTLPLRVLPGTSERFRETLDTLMRAAIRRGKQAAVAVMEPLYAAAEAVASIAAATTAATSPAKAEDASVAQSRVDALDELLRGYAAAVMPATEGIEAPYGGDGSTSGSASVSLPPALSGEEAGRDKDKEEAEAEAEAVSVTPMTLLLWGEHLLRLGRFQEAQDAAEAAIGHTPTMPALWLVKAKALAAKGAWSAAAEAAECARTLDLADRAASVIAVQCMLRCGQLDKAWDAIKVFARPDSDTPAYFRGMLTFWMTLATARAFEEAGQTGRALVRYGWLQRQALGFDMDSHDFFLYTLRMNRIRSTMDLVRFCDEAATIEVFAEAQAAMVRCWLRIADDESVRTDETGFRLVSKEEAAAMSAEESKDLRAARRATKKLRADEAKHSEAVRLKVKGAEDLMPDADPWGVLCTSEADPLAKAEEVVTHFIRSLEHVATQSKGGMSGRKPAPWRTVVLAASSGMDVALRRGKPILALRALAAGRPRAQPTGPGSETATFHPAPGIQAELLVEPEVAPLAARFLRMASDPEHRAKWHPAVTAVVDAACSDPAWEAITGMPAASGASGASGAGEPSAPDASAAVSFASAVADRLSSLGLAERAWAARALAEASGVSPPGCGISGAAPPARAGELLGDLRTGVVTAEAAAVAKATRSALGISDSAADAAAAAMFPEADAFAPATAE